MKRRIREKYRRVLESWMLPAYKLFFLQIKLPVLSLHHWWMKSPMCFDFWGILSDTYLIFEVAGLNLDMCCLKHAVGRDQAFGCHFIPHSVLMLGDLVFCSSLLSFAYFSCMKTILLSSCVYSYLFFWFLLHDIGKKESSWIMYIILCIWVIRQRSTSLFKNIIQIKAFLALHSNWRVSWNKTTSFEVKMEIWCKTPNCLNACKWCLTKSLPMWTQTHRLHKTELPANQKTSCLPAVHLA